MSGSPVSLTAPVQLQGQHNEDCSADNGGSAVKGAGKAEYPRQQRDRHQKDAADLLHCCRPSGNDREHGHACTRIFVATIERQRPEMGRRPQEDDQEQDDWLKPDVASRRCGECRFSHAVYTTT